VKAIPDIKLLKKTKWDINSPRFKEAQLSLGYKDDEVILRNKRYFEEEDYQEQSVVQFRYQHHLIKLKTAINEIIEGRNRIKLRQEPKAANSPSRL